jgi:ubiquinone biosynthesis protein
VAQGPDRSGVEPATPPPPDEVLGPLPRRRQIVGTTGDAVPLPRIRPLKFQAGVFRSLARLLKWLFVIAQILGGNLRDQLTGRDRVSRRARRLRNGLEQAGGTFVKLGQQLAMRIDLLPWDYCVELSKMLDRMPAFPLTDALAAIERTTGRPWPEVFTVFDPEPVGAASIACVYQATLKDGTKVAVKIRRPGIGEVFMADFRVLDWLLGLAEFLTILRPGLTLNLRRELRETLLEELDFGKEAHFQDIFRKNAGKTRKFFTAPAVYFDLSSHEMLVQEFVSGMWLWEIIAAIEQNDSQGLAMMQRLEIDPKILARRILWAAFWSFYDHLFFHADPHPANIVVGPRNTLTFIDFGACGSFDDDQLAAFDQLAVKMRLGDAEGMARATLKLLEPLPPIDLAGLVKALEAEYLRVLYTFRTKAKYTEWWERTSARQWLAMMKTARQYGLPMNLHVLRMVRATLLYDTLVLRLDRSISRYEEYDRFRRTHSARQARRRWRRRARDLRGAFFLRLEELAEAGDDLLSRAEQALSSPLLTFTSLIEKSVFAVSVLSRMVGHLLVITGVAVMGRKYFQPGGAGVIESLWTVARTGTYQVIVLVVIALDVRHLLFRVTDRDVKVRNDTR